MSETGVLYLKAHGKLSSEQLDRLNHLAKKAANSIGYKAIASDGQVDVEIHPPMSELLAEMKKQTDAINRLAESNMALVAAMAEAEGMNDDEDAQPGSYLDGTPCL